jgi:hypothetical protein
MDSAMSAGAPTNDQLLEAARNGDEGALAVLVERHREWLKGAFQGMPGGLEGI